MKLRRILLVSVPAAVGSVALTLGVGGFAGATGGETNNVGVNVGANLGNAVSATALAQPAGKGLKYFTVAASAFVPDGVHNTGEDYFNRWDPSALSNTDPGRCFNAAADLPAKSKIVSVTFYYTGGSAVMYAELNLQDLATGTTVDLASFDSTVSVTPTYTSTTIDVTQDQVVNPQDGYSFGVCPNGTTTFSGVSVAYSS